MCKLYGVVAHGSIDGRPWLMTGVKDLAEQYAHETQGIFVEKVVPGVEVRLPGVDD